MSRAGGDSVDASGAGGRPPKGALAILFLIVFTDLLGFGMVIPLLPLYADQYRPAPEVLGMFLATFSFFQFLFAPILGRLSDRFGRRPVLVISLLGASAGYALLGAAGSLPLLFASRMIAGAAGGNIATAQAIITDVTGPEGRAKGMGIIGAAFGLGFILGPAFAVFLNRVSTSLPGFAAAGASLLALGLTLALLPETNPKERRRAVERDGFSWASLSRALRHWRGISRYLAHPLLGFILVMFFLLVFGFANFESTFSLFLKKQFGLSPSEAGGSFVAIGLVAAVVQGGLIGPLVRRFGEPRLVLAGVLMSAFALGVLPYVGPTAAAHVPYLHIPWPTLLLLLCLAAGTGIVNPSLSSLTSRVADPGEVGGLFGVYQSLGSLGRIAGPFIGGTTFEKYGLKWPFHIASVAMGVCIVLAGVLLARLRAHRREAPAAH